MADVSREIALPKIFAKKKQKTNEQTIATATKPKPFYWYGVIYLVLSFGHYLQKLLHKI